ncbi:hypothetical protein MUY27_09010 [Mucilaginibacter sp. RS28]|uniref:Entericidin n=1 Tax=Mucilaginibacter straminoryzae TaxID=2932774 RepID=A0A9X1X237_9SPHI|nr:hypothetical protein [Mucilaginibacter straminoryzae]MCJ8209847.1 hypothetical protein [Mucilaginibacter straminoryzae]
MKRQFYKVILSAAVVAALASCKGGVSGKGQDSTMLDTNARDSTAARNTSAQKMDSAANNTAKKDTAVKDTMRK